MLPAPLWLVPLAIVITLIVADRPCADCGRWLRHRMLCRRRAL